MAGRPTKQTVDYFPHYVRHGKTMEILEQRYGIAGYYFWFKLLEQLGDSEGHFLDCENPITWEYLASKTKTTTASCEEILNLLATLQAIDQDLWRKDKVVWSQHFVDGISDAYRNRIVDLPSRPNFKNKKSTVNSISDVRNQHSRVEESREENIPPLPPTGGDNDNGRKSKSQKPKTTYMSPDWQISENVKRWAQKNNFGHLEDHREWFVNWAISNAKAKADWDRTFMNCIRGNWGKIDLAKSEYTSKAARKSCPKCGCWIDKCICDDPQKLKELQDYKAKTGGLR